MIDSLIALEKELLLGCESSHPRVALKFKVVRFYCFGKSQVQICNITGLSRNTVKSYIKQFKQGGVNSLRLFYRKYY